MKELACDGIPVTVTCRVLGLARQPYYRWLAAPVAAAVVVEAYRANALFDAHRETGEFGYRLLADGACGAGETMVDRTAWRICADNGWWSTFGKKRAKTGKKPGPAVHDDLCTVTEANGQVRHRFTAEEPNQLWLTDITEHNTSCGHSPVVADIREHLEVGVASINRISRASCARGDRLGKLKIFKTLELD